MWATIIVSVGAAWLAGSLSGCSKDADCSVHTSSSEVCIVSKYATVSPKCCQALKGKNLAAMCQSCKDSSNPTLAGNLKQQCSSGNKPSLASTGRLDSGVSADQCEGVKSWCTVHVAEKGISSTISINEVSKDCCNVVQAETKILTEDFDPAESPQFCKKCAGEKNSVIQKISSKCSSKRENITIEVV